MSFLPYGYNESYVHLPESASFCVKQKKIKYRYQTDNYGGRILSSKDLNKKRIQVFGDSQVLGLDVENIEQHYLNRLYKNHNFVIYAAPNNGPYEVINFLNKNKKIIEEKIIVTFSLSTDLYRILDYWKPEKFVALKDYELDEILENPYKYKLLIIKNLLLNKNFTIIRYDNTRMQNLFIDTEKNDLYKNLIEYFGELDKTANQLNLKIEFIITHPYWVYSIDKKKNKLFLNKKLSQSVEKLICNSFQTTKKISKIYISQVPNSLQLNDLTIDKRHLKSRIIKLKELKEFCK